MEQLLEKDWTISPVPAMRIHLWAWVSCRMGSASRVGELVESSARGYNCNRGLKFEDCKLTVIRKGNGQPGLAFEFERDAKGMTLEPDQRPRHSIYEAPDGESLNLNPIFPVLAIILSRKALRHYETIEEILQIPAPPADETLQLLWKEEMLSQPVFPRFRRGQGLIEGMETANKMADRLRSLGIRAGFPEPLTTSQPTTSKRSIYSYSVSRENRLKKGTILTCFLDLKYSAAQRQRSAGHRSNNVSRRYQPKNSGTDSFRLLFYSQANNEVNETLRAACIEYYPDLIQTLSAAMEDGVYMREQAKISTLENGLLKLHREKAPKSAKNKLWLSDLQHQGCIREGDPLRFFFDRVRHVMPESNTIAELYSVAISLRSPEGLRALDNMITLCTATSEIRIPLGLETCHCLKSDKGWDHVYSCSLSRLKQQYGTAGYCFFCQKWDTGDSWSNHCEKHLSDHNFRSSQSRDRDHRSSLLCNPIKLEGILVTPGLCPFCLSNDSLEPCRRFRQFRDAQVWSCHLLEHCAELTPTSAPISCPHPSCSTTFADTQDFKRHLMDFHCPPHGLWSPRSTLRPFGDIDEDGVEQSLAAGVVKGGRC
ncbi:hypothetical protein F5Y12DRAFT_794881 [Xylaria sp. FL1777]|nr:hypothetical protein F5Y12DRAFT_794881 [Xylaria sp. FL1777]